MRNYLPVITLTKNKRGIYSLDTSVGCRSGMNNELGGCYNDCYAAKSARIYGYDFSKTVLRDFKNEFHRRKIVHQINKINLDFVRIGTSGDPSENWNHTFKILKSISNCNKQIVIITKHWTLLTNEQLYYLDTINICINTSVSALDKPEIISRCIEQYERIKPFCKSILRIVSADFNLENETGKRLSLIQHELFKNESTLDTVLRVNKNNPLVKDDIINVREKRFLGNKTLISKVNKKTFFGHCNSCDEMCGIKKQNENFIHNNKRIITKQKTIF